MEIIKISKMIESVERKNRIRRKSKNIEVKIGDKKFKNPKASDTFREVIEYICDEFGIDEFKSKLNTSLNDSSFPKANRNSLFGYSIEEFPNYVRKGSIKKIPNTDLYLSTHCSNLEKKNFIESLLRNFELDGSVSFIDEEDFDSDDNDIGIVDYIEDEEDEENIDETEPMKNKKYSTLEAAQIILKNNDNNPMTANEIWNEINKIGLDINFLKHTLISRIGHFSINSGHANKSDNPLFKVVSRSPIKYVLLNPESKIIETEVESDSEESYGPEIENKNEKYTAKDPNRVQNPFIQSVCILGEPGVGKSLSTIQAIEKDTNHEFYLSIPTDLSTSMLVQFVGGELKLNKISKMIIKAYDNPETKYTVLIDEFHKPLTIKRVNDELLQAISTKRFGGRRFISSEIAQKYISKKLKRLGFDDKKYYSYHGNIEIPDNFGFIFLSSKPNIVVSNDDLYERMDIVYLTDSENRPDTIEKIQSSRISEISDKNKFKNIIKDTDDDNKDEKKSEILSLVNKKIDISSTKSNESFKNDIVKFDAWRKI